MEEVRIQPKSELTRQLMEGTLEDFLQTSATSPERGEEDTEPFMTEPTITHVSSDEPEMTNNTYNDINANRKRHYDNRSAAYHNQHKTPTQPQAQN